MSVRGPDLSEVSVKIVSFFFPFFQLLGSEQAAAPVCAVQGFISWWAVLVLYLTLIFMKHFIRFLKLSDNFVLNLPENL